MGRSEAAGERLEEAKHINRSLSALGDVMAALAGRGAGHVPFRNSKLTALLQDSLCGQAKAMMFVHVSPEARARARRAGAAVCMPAASYSEGVQLLARTCATGYERSGVRAAICCAGRVAVVARLQLGMSA